MMPFVLEMTNWFKTLKSSVSAVGRPVVELGDGAGRRVGGGVGTGVGNGVTRDVGAGVGMGVAIRVGEGVPGCCGGPVGVTFGERTVVMAWFVSSHT